MFVIDDITFEELNVFGTLYGYHVITGNTNVINSLNNFIIENGNIISSSTTYTDYEIDPSQIELYLYDYKIPINRLECQISTNASPFLSINSSHDILPRNWVYINTNGLIMRSSGFDGEWTFDHIPTTPVEAILFVEFAKQYGVDAIKIDGYNVIFGRGWNLLYIEPKGWITHSYTVYGANNGDLTGYIQYFEGEGSGGSD